MDRFNHFVLTRFNVQVGYAPGRLGLDPTWLSDRFDLFETYCYPSVRQQSNQNFKWLLFFDEDTPDRFRCKVNEYAQWDNFVPLYVKGQYTEAVARQAVLANMVAPAEHLITTRLDNDDAVHRSFIDTIQKNFKNQDLAFLNLTNGYELCGSKLYWRPDAHNPFMSLIQKVSNCTTEGVRTVLGCERHEEVSKIAPVTQIRTRALWLQIIHGRNIRNEVRGIRQPVRKLGGDFPINARYEWKDENQVLCRLDQALCILRTIPKFFNPRKLKKFRAALNG